MTKQLSLIKGFISRHDSVESFNTMLLGASLSCSVHFYDALKTLGFDQ